ncbi:unnamed protein product [Aphanomyces euteiches]
MPPKSQPRKGMAKLPTKKELLERLLALEAGATSPPNDMKKKATWTDEMIQILLDLRLRQFAHVFDGSKSKMQLSIAWEKMTLRFNLLCETSLEPLSLKNKSHVESSKRKHEVALEVQRQRKKRKQLKVDIGTGMVQMGETLANCLIEAAKTANTSSHGDSETTKALQGVLSSLEESKSLNTAILQSISENETMNREILQHLQRR